MGAHPRIGNVLEVPKVDYKYAAKPNSARIADTFRLATAAERSEGMNWYHDAHALAVGIGRGSVEAGAGVIAALSPMMDWERNVMLAARAFEDGAASGALGRNVAKANRILNGEDPLDVLSGPKVRNFYACIVDPMGDGVCVDRHAFDIAIGRVTNDVSRSQLGRVGMYERFAASYVRASRTLSREFGTPISACEVQSTTWVVWRRLKGL